MKHLSTILIALALSLHTTCAVAALDEERSAPPGSERRLGLLEELLSVPLGTTQEVSKALEGTIFNLGQISVSQGRIGSRLGQESAFDLPRNVTVLRRAQLEQIGTDDLPEALNQLEGVTYTDDIGNGLAARVDLRGFGGEGRQALVLLDGLRAVEPFDNSTTWQLYPKDFMRQVEVQRGGGSTIYGEGALSGVIRMKTKGPTAERRITTEHTWGDFRTRKHFVDASGTHENLGYYVGGHYRTTDGYRQNADHEGVHGLTKFTYAFSDRLSVENALLAADSETGIPGPLSQREVDADRRQKDPDGQYGDQFADKLVQDALTVSVYLESIDVELTNQLGYRWREQDSRQTFGGGFGGTSINGIETETFSDVLQASWQTESDHHRNRLTTGVEWSKDDIYNPNSFVSISFGPFEAERAIDRRMLGGFVQNHTVLRERLIVETGIRYDRIDWDIYDLRTPSLQKAKQAEGYSPQIGVEYKLYDPLAVYASYAESFKVPDANTLIFETPNLFSPNPNIDSQRARHHEAGVRYAHPLLGSVRAGTFYIETKKEILFNDITNLNENFDTVRYGVEAANELALTERLQIFSNFTYTQAEFDNGAFDGRTVPLVPESKVSAGVLYEPVRGLRGSAQATGHYGQYALNDFNNIFPIDDYWTLSGKVSYHRGNWEIFLRAENLLGEEYSSFVTSNAVDTVNYNPAPKTYIEAGWRMEI